MKKSLFALLLFGLTVPALAALDVPSGRYVNDPGHTYVGGSYIHLGFSRPTLYFRDVRVVLDLDAGAPENSRLAVEIEAASIDSGVDEFDGHLRGPDFFDVAQFPTLTFKASAIELEDDNSATIRGDLTIKGVTRPVTLNAKLRKAANHPMRNVPAMGFTASTVLKRSDFGLGQYVPMVSDEVEVSIEIELLKADQ